LGDIRVRPAVGVGGAIQSQPKMPQVLAHQLPDLSRILTYTRGEGQSINPAKDRRHGAYGLNQPVDIDFQRQASRRMVGSLLQNVAHVRRDPRKAEQAGFVVQNMQEPFNGQPFVLHEIEERAWIDTSAASAHDDPFKRGEAH